MCASLAIPDNGRIVYSPDGTSPYVYRTVATYSCNPGFGPVGATDRVCGGNDPNNGVWSGSGATCAGMMMDTILCGYTSIPKLSAV